MKLFLNKDNPIVLFRRIHHFYEYNLEFVLLNIKIPSLDVQCFVFEMKYCILNIRKTHKEWKKYMKNLEIILDTNPSGGCGCNCGCGGGNIVEDLNDLAENLKEYEFDQKVNVNTVPIDRFDTAALIQKINELLDNTNAAFRVNEENIEDALSNILPLVVLDGTILTAYGVPTLNDVIMEVNKTLNT